MHVHPDILLLTHKGAPFARLAIPTISTYRKVGAFLYCVKWGFLANNLPERPPNSLLSLTGEGKERPSERPPLSE
jgi:hypothetical protein